MIRSYFYYYFQADLRLIGSGALSDDISRNLTSEVSGPIILQIHKIKNAATPSTKQHNPSPGKRLLRIQLTDGLVHVSAVELEGPLRNFRYAWNLLPSSFYVVAILDFVAFDPVLHGLPCVTGRGSIGCLHVAPVRVHPICTICTGKAQCYVWYVL